MYSEVVHFVLETLNPLRWKEETPLARPFSYNHSTFWSQALQYAESVHAALPFLANLEICEWKQDLPKITRNSFEKAISRERMYLAWLDIESQFALQTLEKAKVTPLLLKGMDLARRTYPKRVFRPMKDVDLLVSHANFKGALETLAAEGYKPIGLPSSKRFRTELSRSQNAPIIEVHSQLLAGDRPCDLDRYWNNSIPADFSDLPSSTRVLSSTDCLIYLIRHAAVQHLIESPLWLNDLHFLIERNSLTQDGIQWSFLVYEMARCQSKTAAWFALSFISKHWKTPVPQEVLQELSPKRNSLRYHFLSQRTAPDVWFPAQPRSWFWVIKARLFLKDSFLGALTYFLNRARAEISEDLKKIFRSKN